MLSVLLLALSAAVSPLASTPQHLSPLVPAKSFQPVSVPFEYTNRHIYVTLSLNGTPGMVFLLDSGSSEDILDLRTSEAMGLKPVSVQQAKGLGLGMGNVRVAAAKDIDARIGDIQVANLMAIVDLQGLQHYFGHREDGILGFPFLQRFVVVLDFDRRLLTLLPARGFRYRGAGDMVSLLEKSKSTSISVELGTGGNSQLHTRVAIDTGSDATLLLYPHYVHDGRLEAVFPSRPAEQAYGLGGYFPVLAGVLPTLLMGSIEARRLSITRMQSDPVFAEGKRLSGVIGNSLLERFQKILFDVPGGRVIFELRPADQAADNRPPLPDRQ